MTGVACILRFALPELDDIEIDQISDSDEDSSETQSEKETSQDDPSEAVHSFDEENLNNLLDMGSELDGSIQDEEEDDNDQIKS